MTEITYVGSRGRDLPVVQQANNIPMDDLSTSRSRDSANEAFLTQNVTSPFTGLLPGSTINGTTVQRQQLLRPFPEFGTFGIEQYSGSDRYEGGTIQLERRFKSGNSFTIQYTRSSLRDTLNYLNPQNGILEDRVSPNDRPNRLSFGASVQLPFGRGQQWGSNRSHAVDAVLGGWQVSGTYQYQSGFPLTFTNNIYYDGARGDPSQLVSHIGEKTDRGVAGYDHPAWDVSCFYFHDAAVQTNGVDDLVKQRADQRIQLSNNVRYFPSTLPNVRTQALHLLDLGISKNFSLPQGVRLQLRIEALNALNYTVLWNPGLDPSKASFGIINQDRNNPRDIQLGLRVMF